MKAGPQTFSTSPRRCLSPVPSGLEFSVVPLFWHHFWCKSSAGLIHCRSPGVPQLLLSVQPCPLLSFQPHPLLLPPRPYRLLPCPFILLPRALSLQPYSFCLPLGPYRLPPWPYCLPPRPYRLPPRSYRLPTRPPSLQPPVRMLRSGGGGVKMRLWYCRRYSRGTRTPY
jgi:hypothetical protein